QHEMRPRLAAVPGVVLVAVAAAMWGTDPIIRKTMSFTTSATTIVFGEHIILAALTLPFLLPALRAVFRAGWSYVVAAVVVGAGAAVLWAMGTELGRYLARRLEFQHIVTLRFFFGLLASALALPIMGASAYSNSHDTSLILYLALATGLVALTLYYYGLQRTPAV